MSMFKSEGHQESQHNPTVFQLKASEKISFLPLVYALNFSTRQSVSGWETLNIYKLENKHIWGKIMFFLLSFKILVPLVLARAAKLKHLLDKRGRIIILFPYFLCWVLKRGLLMNIVKRHLCRRMLGEQGLQALQHFQTRKSFAQVIRYITVPGARCLWDEIPHRHLTPLFQCDRVEKEKFKSDNKTT